MIHVNAEQSAGAHVAQIIQGKNQTGLKFMLQTEIDLDSARRLVVGSKQTEPVLVWASESAWIADENGIASCRRDRSCLIRLLKCDGLWGSGSNSRSAPGWRYSTVSINHGLPAGHELRRNRSRASRPLNGARRAAGASCRRYEK